MDIFNGVCVICTENTLVLSGKDKQKFIELLKEHYFDVNQINDNKFLLQFKEKRSEKSICLSCAYIINCYVNVRNKFVESKTKLETKCSICRIGSNLTNGTTELVKDAVNILKNVNKNKKIPKLTSICLDCCFSIISWNKIKDIILNFEQSDKEEMKNMKKRKFSESEDSVAAFADKFIVPKLPKRRARTRSVSVARNKNDFYPLPAELGHLSNVNHEIVSKDISLNNNITRKVMSDEKLLYQIPYITCETDDFLLQNMTSTPKQTRRSYRSQSVMRTDVNQTKISPPLRNIKRKSSEEPVVSEKYKKMKMKKELLPAKSKNKTTKAKNSKISNDKSDDTDVENNDESPKNMRNSRPRRRSSMYTSASVRDSSSEEAAKNSDESFVLNEVKTTKKSKNSKTKTPIKNNNKNIRQSSRIKRKCICLDNSPIVISDNESESSSTRVSSAANKGRNRNLKPVSTDPIRHECSKCDKSFAKKYRTQLHELEHDVSYSPLVQLTREELLIVRNDFEEYADDVDTLVKQVVSDTLLQLEDEISQNIVNQVVDETLSEIENKINEDAKQAEESGNNESENVEKAESENVEKEKSENVEKEENENVEKEENENVEKEENENVEKEESGNVEKEESENVEKETCNNDNQEKNNEDPQESANEIEKINGEPENKENGETIDTDKQPENTETNTEESIETNVLEEVVETTEESTKEKPQEVEIISENGETEHCEQTDEDKITKNANNSEEISDNGEKENSVTDANVIENNSSTSIDDGNKETITENVSEEQEKIETCIINNEINEDSQNKDNETTNKSNVDVEENGRISDNETNSEISENINENRKNDTVVEIIDETQSVDVDNTNGSCNTRDVKSDKYEIVENLLQNLGA